VSAGRAAVERTLDAATIAVIKARACRAEWAFIAPAADRGDAEARDAMWEKGRPIGQAAQRAQTELKTALAYLANPKPAGPTGADRGLVIHGLQALTPPRLRRKAGTTLSDREGQGERTPTRRSARVFVIGLAMSETHRNGTFWTLKAGKPGWLRLTKKATDYGMFVRCCRVRCWSRRPCIRCSGAV
jgi:hypothetical protein